MFSSSSIALSFSFIFSGIVVIKGKLIDNFNNNRSLPHCPSLLQVGGERNREGRVSDGRAQMASGSETVLQTRNSNPVVISKEIYC